MLSEKPWRIEAVLQFIGVLIFCWCLGQTIAALLHAAGVGGFRQSDSLGILILCTMSFQGVAWIFALIFLRQHQVSWLKAFGFCGPRLKNSWLFIVGILVVVLPPATSLLQAMSGTMLEKLGLPVENQRAVQMFLDTKSFWFRGYLGFFAIVLAPVAEEFIFRGVLYPFVKQQSSPRWAFFGISFIFAEIHLDAGTLVPLFALALVLTWLYEKTDNLLAPIAAHSLFNATNVVALNFLPQINEFLERHLHIQVLK